MHAPRLPSENESAILWHSDSDDANDDDENTESEHFSSIRQCYGIAELHYQGVVLDGLMEGPQVEKQAKQVVMWMAGWNMDREVDLKVVLRRED